MKYLMDVNALLAAIIQNHPGHRILDSWMRGKKLVVCPLSELGFLRISTHPRAYNLKMAIARQALSGFIASSRVDFISADLPSLRAASLKSEDVTDDYLAELAASHDLKLATLDEGIGHPAVELIK